MRRLLLAAIAALILAGGAALVVRAGGGSKQATPATSSTTRAAATTTTTTLPTTTASTASTPPAVPWPAIATSGEAKAVVTPAGVVLPVVRPAGARWVVTSPCGHEVVVAGTPLFGAAVVLDPGHGGDEPGAVGQTGLTEKDLNLSVALETKRQLEARGATVVLTRTADYRVTIKTRGLLATRLAPMIFLSIHHNAEPDGPRDGPGSETYFQIKSPTSKRAAGLIYQEVVGAFSPYKIAWVADRDAGAKFRPRADGTDYYGVLSRSAGVTAVLSEAAFVTNPPEEALLRTPEFQAVEAAAFTRAIVRYVSTQDPGSGYVDPYPRTEPAGSGGGSSGCVDPKL